MSSAPGTQEKPEKSQDPPQFKFGYVSTKMDDKASTKVESKTVPAPASDFKFSFGYVPDQEPPRKSLRSHTYIDRPAAEPGRSLSPNHTSESKVVKRDAASKTDPDPAKESTDIFAFSFTGASSTCKPPGDGTKTVFSFPNMGPQRTDDSAQNMSSTEHGTSLVSTKNHTTTQSIDKKNYQNKDSLFEGGDVEFYCYDKEEGKWITQNKGYLQVISVKEFPDERQIVFSRIGTSVVVINSRLSKGINIISDKKQYIKIALQNDLTKSALIALFKFATEELRDACLAAMPQQDSSKEDSSKEKSKECTE